MNSDQYSILPPESQYEVLTWISYLPCAATRSLTERNKPSSQPQPWCKTCDSPSFQRESGPPVFWNEVVPREEYTEIITLLSTIVEDTDVRRSRKPRILAARAMQRVVNHLSDEDFLALGTNPFGAWLMRSLQSSVRELRIASA
jgi:serine/threonine-protein kinase ATR